jgi:hypothetical protein
MNLKNLRVVVIAIVCIAVICGGLFLFSQNLNQGNPDELTELQKVIVEDLEGHYPPTPREVVKFYNRIVQCYHQDGLKKDELGKLVDQMMRLWDEDMLAKNSKETYLAAVQSDIELYKQTKKTIVSITVCDSNDVITKTDDRNGDKLAFVETTYFVNTNGEFTNSHMIVGLRQNSDGEWKIIGVTLKEAEKDE